MKRTRLFVSTLILIGVTLATTPAMADDPPGDGSPTFTLHPIGRVEVSAGHARIILDKNYQPGLLGLDGYSHIQVFWWFSQNDTAQKRSILQVHPRGNRENPLTGVFATRARFRPNLIALTLCKITSIQENVIEVEKIDAFDGTPVLDIKPYIPGYDNVEQAATPEWLRKSRPPEGALDSNEKDAAQPGGN